MVEKTRSHWRKYVRNTRPDESDRSLARKVDRYVNTMFPSDGFAVSASSSRKIPIQRDVLTDGQRDEFCPREMSRVSDCGRISERMASILHSSSSQSPRTVPPHSIVFS